MAIHKRLFFLLLACIPIQLGYHFWPSWTLVLGRRIDYLSPTAYLTDIIIFLILCFWIIEKKKIVFPWVICLFIAVNIFFSLSKPVAIYAWVKVIEYLFLGIYIIATKPDDKKILYFLSIGVFYSSIIGIVQFFLQRSIGGPFWYFGERTFDATTTGIAKLSNPLVLRAYSLFPHPNVFGGYLAILLPLIFNEAKKKFYLFTFILGLVALIVSFSRSAWIICILAMLYRMRFRRSFLLCLLLAGLLFFYFALTADESIMRRLSLQDAAFAVWKSSPLFGVGLGNFLVALPHFYSHRDIFFLQPVHNIYLLLLSEIGVIGFIGSLYLVMKRISIPLISILLLGFFDHYFLTLQQGQIFTTLVIAMIYSKNELQKIIR